MCPISTTRPDPPSAPADPAAEEASTRARRQMVVGFLLLLMLAGGALRMYRLGALGLNGDEGYQYRAVQAVLDHGVPRLETGYVYLRAPHFIYLQAGVAKAIGLNEFALRLPAAVFGVLCIPLGYLLGRDLVNARVGVLLALLLAFSAWEVELSRYARFYTLLQACTIAGIWCFYRGYIGGSRGHKAGYWLLLALAIATHQLGALLGACLLVMLPLSGYTRLRRLGYTAQFGAVAGLFLVWRVIETSAASLLTGPGYVPLARRKAVEMTRPQGSQDQFHVGLVPDFVTPRFKLAGYLWHNHPVLMPVLVGVSWALLGVVLLLMIRRRQWGVGLLSGAALVFASGQLGALSGVCVLLLLAVGVHRGRDLGRPIIALGVFGSVGLLGAAVLLSAVADGRGVVTSAFDALRYPDVSRFLLEWMYRGWKVVALLAVVGAVLVAARSRSDDDRCTGRWLLLGALVIPVVAASWVGGKHNESRYFFFLYPLILLLAAVAIRAAADAAGRWLHLRAAVPVALGLVFAGMMTFSRDYRPMAVWGVTDRTYAQVRDPDRAPLNLPYYAGFHQDQATPGRYVREHRREGERVLVVGPPHRSVNYAVYVGRVDFIVGQPEYYTRLTLDDAGRLRDPDTGAELIWQPERLREVLATSGGGSGLWVLSDHGLRLDWPIQIPEDMKAVLFERVDPPRTYIATDGVSLVSHLEPGMNPQPPTIVSTPTDAAP